MISTKCRRPAVLDLLRQEFYGLARNDAVLLERAHKEVLRETGHLFGLAYGGGRCCAMSLRPPA
jgi:predicted Zn-dependent protease